MNGFYFINAGLQSSIQDLGRDKFTHIGVSESGAMDEYAYNMANSLLGNPYGTNTLEITLGNIEFEVRNTHTNIVFTGAKAPITKNDTPIKMWQSFHVKSGDTIKVGFTTEGQRLYLGVEGGFEVEKILDSYSVNIKEGFGKILKNKDILHVTQKVFKESRKLQEHFIPRYLDHVTLRVVPAYQYEDFDKKEVEKFFNTSYEVTNQSNRMGFRLKGSPLKNVQKGIISEGIAYGAVQIPSHGEPIVLLKERQTIGGYPKIGSIIPIDCFVLSQCKPTTKINFQPILIQEAVQKMQEFYKIFL